jgi:tetratricopeptide (TPR) repeat protein
MIINGAMRSGPARLSESPVKELLMRYFPVALALSLALMVTGSMGQARVNDPVDPRAGELLANGRFAMAHGDIDTATDAFESALVIDPGHVGTLVALGDAARKSGMQGKAIHYYRVALERDANDIAAISGEGSAMAEKGALGKARVDLTRLEGLCGKACPEARSLADAIAKGPAPKVVSADAVKPQPMVQAN